MGGSAEMCGANACVRTPQGDEQFNFMGYTMRTAEWRYTAWVRWDHTARRANWSQPVTSELFNLTDDTGRDFDFHGYSVNLANGPEHGSTVQMLKEKLRAAVATWPEETGLVV